MLAVYQCKTFLRFVTILVLLLFFPTSVQAWNFLPEERATAPQSGTEGGAAGSTRPLPATAWASLRLLSEAEMRDTAGLPAPAEAASPHATPAWNLPPARKLVAKLKSPGIAASLVQKPVSKAAPAPQALTIEELAEATGGQDTRALLDKAAAHLEDGANLEAAVIYFDILNSSSRSEAAVEADEGLAEIVKRMENGEITPAKVSEFLDSVPAFEKLETVESRYSMVHFMHQQALTAVAEGDKESAADLHRMCRDAAWATLQENPDHPLQIDVASFYYESADNLGYGEAVAAAKELEALVEKSEPCPVRLGGRFALGRHMKKYENDPGRCYLNYADLLSERKFDYVDESLKDAGVYPWIKAWMLYYFAQSCYDTGRNEEAIAYYDRIIEEYPDSDKVFGMAQFSKAFVTDQSHRKQPAIGLKAYSAYLEKSPEGEFAHLAWYSLAAVYYRSHDYASASEILIDVMQNYPDTKGARWAEKLAGYMMRHDLMPSGEVTTAEESAAASQMCGPVALQKLLALKGIESTVEELAVLAGTTDTGTSMYGLAKASARKGVELVGIKASDVTQLKAPFIAFVNGNHFVLVSKLIPGGVVMAGVGERPDPVTAADFAALWDGCALVCADSVEGLDGLESTEMMTALGGCNTLPTGTPPISMSHSPPTGATGSPTGNMGQAGHVQAYQTAQFARGKDLSLNVKGGIPLRFSRTFFNRWGLLRTDIDGSEVWQNNVGRNWNHNYNLRIQTSSGTEDNGAPTDIVFYDDLGDVDYFEYYTTAGDYDRYLIIYSESTSKLMHWIYRCRTSGAFTKILPSGTQYGFSAPTADANRIARLEWIADPSGNEVALEYDGANGIGKLTKVTAPAPDPRYLSLEYAGGRVTKAELRNGSGSLADVTCEYDGNADLTKVTGTGGQVTEYAYATVGGITTSHYLSSFIDPGDTQTTFALSYDESSYEDADYACTKISVTTPDSVTATYERDQVDNGLSSMDNLTLASGVTDLLKTRYDDSTDGFLVGTMKYWEDPDQATSTKNWSYDYIYDRDLTKITRPDGTTQTEYTYRVFGQVASVTDAYGEGTTFDYASYFTDQPITITNPMGLETTIEYDDLERMTKAAPPGVGGSGYQLDLNAAGQITSATDPGAGTSAYGYDTLGNLTSITDSSNVTTYSHYDDLGRVTRKVDGLGHSTYYYYDDGCASCGGGGRLTRVTDALNNDTEYRYDQGGRMTKLIDALDRETDYAHDDMGRLTSITSPSGSFNQETYEYDLLGNRTRITDANGTITNFTFDGLGNLLTKSVGASPGTTVETYGYDSIGNRTRVTDGRGMSTWYYHDAAARLTKETDAESKVKMYQYDVAGKVTKEGATINGTCDPVERFYSPTTGLLSKIQYTNAQTSTDYVEYYYDANSQLTRVRDWMTGAGNGNHYFDYDGRGRVTRYRDFDDFYASNEAHRVEYTYDGAGRVITQTVVEGNGTTNSSYCTLYGYNDVNRVTSMTTPDAASYAVSYNALGQPTQTTHPNGMTTSYGYDARNRLSLLEHKDGTTTMDGWTYELDDEGNITRIMDANDEYWDYEYDGRYRLTKADRNNSTASVKASYAYTYDDGDNLLTKVMPFEDNFNDGDYNGWTVETGTLQVTSDYVLTKTSTATGRMAQSTSDADYDMWFSYRWDSTETAERLQIILRFVDWNNFLYLNIAPNQMGLVERVSGSYYTRDLNISATTVQDTWYNVYVRCDDEVSVCRAERGSGTEMAQVLCEGMDLSVATTTSIKFSIATNSCFSLDDIRIASSDLSTTVAYVYNDANELTSMTEGQTGITGCTSTFEYDDWGRTTKMTKAAIGDYTLYKYRYGDKLKRVSKYESTTLTDAAYMYDGLGKQRFSWLDGQVESWTRWGIDWQPIASCRAGSDPGTEWDVGERTLSFARDPLGHGFISVLGAIIGSNPASGAHVSIFKDRLGSLRRLRAADKGAFGSYEFTPYGQAYFCHGMELPFGFTGKNHMEESGMLYFPHRLYSPSTARWLTRDPLGMIDGPNRYAYVKANPASAVDPLGLAEGGPHSVDDPCRGTATGAQGQRDCKDCCRQLYSGDVDDGMNALFALYVYDSCQKECEVNDDGPRDKVVGQDGKQFHNQIIELHEKGIWYSEVTGTLDRKSDGLPRAFGCGGGGSSMPDVVIFLLAFMALCAHSGIRRRRLSR